MVLGVEGPVQQGSMKLLVDGLEVVVRKKGNDELKVKAEDQVRSG